MRLRAVLIGCAPLLMMACSSLELAPNLEATQSFARERFATEVRLLDSDQERRAAQEEVDRLLQAPLPKDAAQRIALAYSPAFQSLLFEGAEASARATQSARLANPVFSFEKLVRREEGVRELDITRMLSLPLIDLILLPARRDIANTEQQRLRMRAAGQVVQTVTEAREAWVRAVAANQARAYAAQVMKAAELSAELARRMQAAGNFSRLQRARQQAFYAEAAAQSLRAAQLALETREALVRVLGLNDVQAANLRLPERLPDLPAAPRDEQGALQGGLDERIDLRLARHELAGVARSQGLTRLQSVVNGFEVAGIVGSESGKPSQRGYELSMPLPLFDTGDATRAGAQAAYMAAFNRVVQTGVDASSRLRQQYGAYRTAYELARHYRDEIVPLRKTISDEVLLKYNGMLEGVFELLADAREQVASVIGALDAQRDFWLADAALQAEMLGKPVSFALSAAPQTNPEATH